MRVLQEFLGHLVDKDGIRADPSKAVVQMEAPQTTRDMRRFLGMMNQLGKFSPRIDWQNWDSLWERYWAPRTLGHGVLSRSVHSPTWKRISPNPPFWRPLQPTGTHENLCQCFGAVLLQKNEWKPVTYASQSLTETDAQIRKRHSQPPGHVRSSEIMCWGSSLRLKWTTNRCQSFSITELSSVAPFAAGCLGTFLTLLYHFSDQLVDVWPPDWCLSSHLALFDALMTLMDRCRTSFCNDSSHRRQQVIAHWEWAPDFPVWNELRLDQVFSWPSLWNRFRLLLASFDIQIQWLPLHCGSG